MKRRAIGRPGALCFVHELSEYFAVTFSGVLAQSFQLGAYRSVAILCGRILEVCLHRKYFDATGFDILEKNPGIGLGSLVGKLNDKNVKFDPGIKEQIHLINQVRIFSVHKKKEPFYPTKEQAQAMILYLMDVLRKLYI